MVDRLTELPNSRYRFDADGVVVGPGGGRYEPTGYYDEFGYEIYKNQNSSHYQTFHDGQTHSTRSPYRDRNSQIGLTGEIRVTGELQDLGWNPIGGTQTATTNFTGALNNYSGTTGIDGIFKRRIGSSDPPQYEYIVVETKASANGRAGDLEDVSSGATQMSDEWLSRNIDRFFPNTPEGRLDRDAVRAPIRK